jgi:DNA-binding NarL/FixJ family response regulator
MSMISHQAGAPEQTAASNKLINVIMIEDHSLSRVGIRAFLSRTENIRLIGEAENAEKGLYIVRSFRPNVVLMDLGLPGMNGIEATRQIKSIDRNIKVIILTSHEHEEDVVAAFAAGADGYCIKDIDPSLLPQVIETVASGGGWMDPRIAGVALKLGTEDQKPIKRQSSRDTNQLTEREMEVLRLLVDGKSNTEIAKELIVSVHTAKAHVCNILHKLYVNDRVQAAVKAIREGMV